MSVLYLVLPLALILVAGALAAYAWAARTGQFDDLETPAWRILFEDDIRRDACARAADDGRGRRKGADGRPRDNG